MLGQHTTSFRFRNRVTNVVVCTTPFSVDNDMIINIIKINKLIILSRNYIKYDQTQVNHSDRRAAIGFDSLLKPGRGASTIRGAKPYTGEVAEWSNALVLKTSKGL